MRTHVVTILPTGKRKYAASHTEAVKIRMDLMDRLGLKRNAIEISSVEIPTTKTGLLDWLNVNG